MLNWFVSVFSAVSQLVNAVIGGNPNESISGRAYRLRNSGWGWVYRVINTVFWFQEDHCQQANFNDVQDATIFLDAYEASETFNKAEKVAISSDMVNRAEFYENNNDALGELTAEQLLEWRQWFENNDVVTIVNYYSTATLMRIVESGTNFAFTKSLAKKINSAATQEWYRRGDLTVPTMNGMGKDGGQK